MRLIIFANIERRMIRSRNALTQQTTTVTDNLTCNPTIRISNRSNFELRTHPPLQIPFTTTEQVNSLGTFHVALQFSNSSATVYNSGFLSQRSEHVQCS